MFFPRSSWKPNKAQASAADAGQVRGGNSRVAPPHGGDDSHAIIDIFRVAPKASASGAVNLADWALHLNRTRLYNASDSTIEGSIQIANPALNKSFIIPPRSEVIY